MKTIIYLIVAGLYLCRGQEQDYCGNWPDYKEVRCLVNKSGYALHTCKPLVIITGDPEDAGKNVWVAGNEIRCSKPLHGCRCYDHNYATWWDQDCECYNPTPAPDFPPFGAISWKGVLINQNTYDKDAKREFVMKGVACKLKNGTYLKKERKRIDGVEVNAFELVIPNKDGETYIKYSGSDITRVCGKLLVKDEGSLTQLWHDKTRFAITSEVNTHTKLRSQTWKYNDDGEDHYEWYQWIVDYDGERDHAIPSYYYFYFYDDIEGDKDTIELHYSYKEHHEDCRHFTPAYYCNNV